MARLIFQTRGTNFSVDGDGRIPVVISSDDPVDMPDGPEILMHRAGAVDMSRMPLPIIVTHQFNVLNVGVIEEPQIVNGTMRGYAKFGERPEAAQYRQDVINGTIRSVSVAYSRNDGYIRNDGVLVTTKWTPRHVAMIGEPADPKAGFFRALNADEDAEFFPRQVEPTEVTDNEQPVVIESRSKSATPAAPASAVTSTTGDHDMKRHIKQEAATDGTAGAAGGAATIDQNALRIEAATSERQRAAEIEALCHAHGVDADLRRGLIQRGASVAEARGAVLDLVLQRGEKQKPAASLGNGHAPDMSDNEKARYSMLRAINAAISGNWKEAGFEMEVSNDIGKRMGKDTKGFFMPTNIPFAQRAQYAAGAANTGGALVASNLLAGSFIEVLRNKARVLQLGATVLGGLTGNVVIPRQTGASSTYWVAETGAVTESEATFDQLALSFKSIGTKSAITRSMLMQSTPDVEMIARADLIAQIALGIDLAALSGLGSSNQPLGIANTSGIGSVVGGTNGAQLTIDHLIALETAIATANADVDNMAYLCNAKTVGWLKGLKSTTGQYLWTNLPNGGRGATPGEINGYTVARSNQARATLTKGSSGAVCSEIFMGNWSELVIGEWGVLEIMPNPYDATLFPQGGVLLRAMQSCDIGVRHASSFAVMSDALPQ